MNFLLFFLISRDFAKCLHNFFFAHNHDIHIFINVLSGPKIRENYYSSNIDLYQIIKIVGNLIIIFELEIKKMSKINKLANIWAIEFNSLILGPVL